jgi:pimeloyl-ACP methyl ester carboxylesterase
MMPVNGIEVCAETFGEPTDPALLLIAGGASSMDWWEDEFCRRLAAGGRFVIRYDHRDTGRSTSFPAGSPPYSAVDLAVDAVGVLDALAAPRAHLVGLGLGGVLAQRVAVEHPGRMLSLTLMATGPLTTTPPAGPDWSHRRTAVDCMVARLRDAGGPFTADLTHLRRLAERVYDRTRDMAAAQTNHWLIDPGPPVQPADIAAPTLLLHGTLDRRCAPPQTLAAEIPGARLVWLDGVGHEFPPTAVWAQVIDEIIDQGQHQPA